jgi:hypothetical protein
VPVIIVPPLKILPSVMFLFMMVGISKLWPTGVFQRRKICVSFASSKAEIGTAHKIREQTGDIMFYDIIWVVYRYIRDHKTTECENRVKLRVEQEPKPYTFAILVHSPAVKEY